MIDIDPLTLARLREQGDQPEPLFDTANGLQMAETSNSERYPRRVTQTAEQTTVRFHGGPRALEHATMPTPLAPFIEAGDGARYRLHDDGEYRIEYGFGEPPDDEHIRPAGDDELVETRPRRQRTTRR